MKKLYIAFILIFHSFTYSDGVEETIPSNVSLLRNPNFDVLVVTVLEANSENRTNANPPRGKFRVDKVLRGHTAPGLIPFSLMPPITADDYDENKKMRAPWYEKPLEGPTVGDK